MYIRKVVVPIIFLLITIIAGTVGYMWTENFSVFDSLWLAAVSILTIGYGDIAPATPHGKIFTLIIIPIAIGLVTYILAQFASSIIEGNLANEVKKKLMDKKISKLQEHIIVCGYGRVGRQVISQLKYEEKPYVIIEEKEEEIESISGSCLYIFGDAKKEQTLLDAGIERASSIILTLPDDADNLFVTLTAKSINTNIQVISRAEDEQSEKILYQAGVDKVIITSNIGGRRMAMSVIKPNSVEYVETLLNNNDIEYSVEEIKLSDNSLLVNTSIKESRIREKYGVNVIAIKRKNIVISNPKADERLQSNDLIIVFGSADQLTAFESAAF